MKKQIIIKSYNIKTNTLSMSVDNFFKCYYDLHDQTFSQIVLEWGKSTVTLKNWLNTFYPQPLDKVYSRKADIDSDLFLPYRKNRLFTGENAISRLKLAVKAKAVIIYSNADLSEIQQDVVYRTECLRLWCRINSLTVKFPFESFKNLLNDTKELIDNDLASVVEELQTKTPDFKFKRKQTLYHYKQSDFDIVSSYMPLKEAYNTWIEITFPHLLDRFKEQKIREFQIKSMNNEWSQEYKEEQYNRFLEDFKLIRIKKPSKAAFKELLKRFNISYKQIQNNSRKRKDK